MRLEHPIGPASYLGHQPTISGQEQYLSTKLQQSLDLSAEHKRASQARVTLGWDPSLK